MAGRGSLFVALALLTTMSGCTSQQQALQSNLLNNRALNSEVTPPPGAEIKKGDDLPKRTPKASTCVAFGDFCAVESAAPKQQPAVRDQRRAQGKKAYQQALDIDPKNLKAALGLARLQSTSGEHDAAIATLQKASKYHGDNAALWCELGMIQARKKDWDSALKSLEKTTQLEPSNRQYTTIRGYTLARAGRYDESLACFLQIDSEAKAHYNLARMLGHMDKPDLSRTHLQLALAKNPELECAREMLALLDQPSVPTTPSPALATHGAVRPSNVQTAPAPAAARPPVILQASAQVPAPASRKASAVVEKVESAELPDLLPPPPQVLTSQTTGATKR